MPVIGNSVLTLADIMQGRRGDGSFDHEIVELFLQENPMLDDITIIQANDGTANRTTIRTGIPEPTWINYYNGVKPAKGAKTQVKDVAGRMRAMLEIDADLYNDTPDKDQFLQDELFTLTEGMTQAMAECLIFGKIANDPRAFNGLYNFYGVAGADSNQYDSKDAAHYVFSGTNGAAKGGESFRSISLIGWSPSTITGFYPQGHKSAGIQRGALRKVDTTDADGGVYQVMRQELTWELGLSVRDYRYGGRIANIDAAKMLTQTDVDYVELIHRLVSRVKNSSRTKRAMYMSPDLWEKIQVLFYRKTQGNAIAYTDVMQRLNTPTLLGIPVRLSDALEVDEQFVA